MKITNRIADRNKVIEELQGLSGSKETMTLIADAVALLKEQSEIVRCKDCRYGEGITNILGEDRVKCNLSDSFVYRDITLPPDWYCADWEAKQDD